MGTAESKILEAPLCLVDRSSRKGSAIDTDGRRVEGQGFHFVGMNAREPPLSNADDENLLSNLSDDNWNIVGHPRIVWLIFASS